MGEITQLLFGIPKSAGLNKTREASASLPNALIIEMLAVYFYYLRSKVLKRSWSTGFGKPDQFESYSYPNSLSM